MPTRGFMSANQKGGWGKVFLAGLCTLILLTGLLAIDAHLGIAVGVAAFVALLVRFVFLVLREM